eukprot:PhM_4_TR18481/c4_g1_i1/m.65470
MTSPSPSSSSSGRVHRRDIANNSTRNSHLNYNQNHQHDNNILPAAPSPMGVLQHTSPPDAPPLLPLNSTAATPPATPERLGDLSVSSLSAVDTPPRTNPINAPDALSKPDTAKILDSVPPERVIVVPLLPLILLIVGRFSFGPLCALVCLTLLDNAVEPIGLETSEVNGLRAILSVRLALGLVRMALLYFAHVVCAIARQSRRKPHRRAVYALHFIACIVVILDFGSIVSALRIVRLGSGVEVLLGLLPFDAGLELIYVVSLFPHRRMQSDESYEQLTRRVRAETRFRKFVAFIIMIIFACVVVITTAGVLDKDQVKCVKLQELSVVCVASAVMSSIFTWACAIVFWNAFGLSMFDPEDTRHLYSHQHQQHHHAQQQELHELIPPKQEEATEINGTTATNNSPADGETLSGSGRKHHHHHHHRHHHGRRPSVTVQSPTPTPKEQKDVIPSPSSSRPPQPALMSPSNSLSRMPNVPSPTASSRARVTASSAFMDDTSDCQFFLPNVQHNGGANNGPVEVFVSIPVNSSDVGDVESNTQQQQQQQQNERSSAASIPEASAAIPTSSAEFARALAGSVYSNVSGRTLLTRQRVSEGQRSCRVPIRRFATHILDQYKNSLCNSARSAISETIQWKEGYVLGKGAFGTVCVGLNEESGELIAVKKSHFEAGDPELNWKLEMLRNEISILRKLNHPNIVRYLGVEKKGTDVAIILEYVPGGSIQKVLMSFGALAETVVAQYAYQITQGLAYLHLNHVLHGDIKGANIMVGVDGLVKLADFGSATIVEELAERRGSQGTPLWMAPEIIRGECLVGWASDIWALGCTVIEMLTGLPPWSHVGSPMLALRIIADMESVDELPLPEVITGYCSKECVAFIRDCCIRDASKRPTAEELLRHPFFGIEDSVQEMFIVEDISMEALSVGAGALDIANDPTEKDENNNNNNNNNERCSCASSMSDASGSVRAIQLQQGRTSPQHSAKKRPGPLLSVEVPSEDESSTSPVELVPLSEFNPTSAASHTAAMKSVLTSEERVLLVQNLRKGVGQEFPESRVQRLKMMAGSLSFSRQAMELLARNPTNNNSVSAGWSPTTAQPGGGGGQEVLWAGAAVPRSSPSGTFSQMTSQNDSEQQQPR